MKPLPQTPQMLATTDASPCVSSQNNPVPATERETSEAVAALIPKLKDFPAQRPVTTAILSFNVLVFLLMALDGGGFMEPNGIVAIHYGSNFTPLTLTGDWWRLISSTFIHFGFLHIFMNTLGLITMGAYLEPLLGRIGFMGAYIAAGVCAAITSLLWHSNGINSAGASGAIFGLAGLHYGLLWTNLIPQNVRAQLRRECIAFIVYGLFYGLKARIDNAAHAGGLIAGVLFSALFMWALKGEETKERRTAYCGVLALLMACATAVIFLQEHTLNQSERQAALVEIQKQQKLAQQP
jgi:rhomboid protease GluP